MNFVKRLLQRLFPLHARPAPAPELNIADLERRYRNGADDITCDDVLALQAAHKPLPVSGRHDVRQR